MNKEDVNVRVMLLGSCLADLFSLGLSESEVRAVVADALDSGETIVTILELGSGVPDIITTHRESPKPAPLDDSIRDMTDSELKELSIRSAAALCASELVTAAKMTKVEFTSLYDLWLRTRRLVVTRGRVR